MSIGKWLKGATRIRFDDRTLGNLTKNAAVGAGTVVGGPLGLAIGAGGGALGQATLGGNLGESLNAGFKGAANTGLAQAGKGLLGRAIGGGAPLPSAPPVENVGNALPSAATDTVSSGLALPSVPDLTTSAVKQSPGFLQSALDKGGSLAEWAGKHDKTSSALLGGLGDVLDPTEERLQRAQTRALERRTDEDDYAFQRRKASDLALEPIRQALYGSLGTQIGNNYGAIPKNPYAGTT